jgi:LAS superfamily LD-carboxypeptidase LdcB
MRQAARADGVTQLRQTSTYDTYRPYTIQKAVFLQRYVREPVSKNVRRWDGQVWYLKPGLAPLASPGTSIHGFGCAIDIWNVGQNGRLEWLTDNAPRFGFYWEKGVEKSEPWHLIYTLGDKTP